MDICGAALDAVVESAAVGAGVAGGPGRGTAVVAARSAA